MATFFNGWIGYGSVVQAGVLLEPADPFYVRRPYVLGSLDQGIVSDVGSGTVGPATVNWGRIGFAALFDSQSGGNLLLWMALPLPLLVLQGGTITSGTGANRLYFPDLQDHAARTRVWPAGSVLASTFDGRVLTTGVPLQCTGGVLSAQVSSFGTTVTMTGLPALQPTSGAGQLWNNGGVISVT